MQTFREIGLDYFQKNVNSIGEACLVLYISTYEYISYVFLDQATCLYNLFYTIIFTLMLIKFTLFLMNT